MKVSEAAEYLGITVTKLTDKLLQQYPEESWSQSSELPDEFIELIEEHAETYKQHYKLTSTEKSSQPEHIESIEYGILEALEQFKLEHIELRASIGAVRDWENYKQTYERTLAEIYQREISDRTSQNEKIVQSLIASRDESRETSNKLMGELKRTQLTIQARMQQLRKLAG